MAKRKQTQKLHTGFDSDEATNWLFLHGKKHPNVLYLMSCHVIIRNRLSLSMGSWDVAAGANPSLVSGRGQGIPWTSRQFITGPLLMSNVGFSVLLKDIVFNVLYLMFCFVFNLQKASMMHILLKLFPKVSPHAPTLKIMWFVKGVWHAAVSGDYSYCVKYAYMYSNSFCYIFIETVISFLVTYFPAIYMWFSPKVDQ